MDSLDDILERLGLSHLIPVFTANLITKKIVNDMSDDDFGALGITAIGDRVRLKQACRDELPSGNKDSPILKRLKQFSDNRRKGRSNVKNNSKPKDTRKVYVGWKHQGKLITANKGGGTQTIDLEKNLSFAGLMAAVKGIFFPMATNAITGLSTTHLKCTITTFTGRALQPSLNDGDEFTLQGFITEHAINPVRLYLSTAVKGVDDTGQSGQEEYQELNVPGSSHPEENQLENDPVQETEERNDLSDISESFEEAGTPTVLIRRRSRALLNRLSLRRQEIRARTDTDADDLPDIPDEHDERTPVQLNEDVLAVTDESEAGVERMSTPRHEGPSELTLTGILTWWQNKSLLTELEPMEMVIKRDDLLTSTMRLVRRDTFNVCRPIKIDFSGEDGDDLGGPRREFLQLLMTALCKKVFEGNGEKKFFRHDLEYLGNKTYEMAGMMCAFSLLNGGPGMPVMHPLCYSLLINTEFIHDDIPSVEECINNIETKEKLLKLQKSTDQTEYDSVLEQISDWCFDQSLSILNFRQFSERDSLVKILIKNEVFYRLQSEYTQFRNGLNKVGRFIDALQLAPLEFECLFIHTEKPLRFRDIRALYTIDWSPNGSNNRRLEKQAIYCLEAFLADCEGGTTEVSLDEVLTFWTGASKIPPLGFEKKLEISFSAEKRLPSAHTCALILNIWRGFEDPDVFAEFMTRSLKWDVGFHLV